MLIPAFRFHALPARLCGALRHIFGNTNGTRSRNRYKHHLTPALVEQLESRVLLSVADLYPEMVPTVGVYDENALQTNTVDTVAPGSSMTNIEFADHLATAWANNKGGVIDGTAVSTEDIYGYGQDLERLLFVVSMDDTGFIHDTPTDREAISGTGAFATTYSASQQGSNAIAQWFFTEGSNDDKVLEFGLTVLGQTLEEYGTIFLYGYLEYGEEMLVSYQVQSGGAEDVFYGLKAPTADYFTGFVLGYVPEGQWNVDQPLWFDDFGFIMGDYLAGGNQAPTAVDDAYTTQEDSTLTVNASYYGPGNGVLKNDFDLENHDLRAALVSGPSHGTLAFNYRGGFTYTPDANFFGTDSFTYKALDVLDESNVATVTLTVTPVNDPFLIQDDAYTLNEDEALVVDSPGVLANDSDPDGGEWTALVVSGPAHGTLTLAADGSFLYTPDENFHGEDAFTYRATDGTEFSDIATVSLTVADVNAPPVATNDLYELDQNGSLSVGGPGVLANDSDQDGDPITALLVSGPFHGTLTLEEDGSFSYTPHLNFVGTDTFRYRATDGTNLSNIVTVTLTVLLTNAAPVGVADGYVLDENTTLNVSGPGVLANDSDPEGQPLTAELVTGPAHGTFSLAADGSFSYTPLANFHGQVTFKYRAYDGVVPSAPITVTLNVLSVNVLPVANDDSFTVGEDGTLLLPNTYSAHLTMVSEPGDYIGQGLTYDLDQADGTFIASRNFDNGVRIFYNANDPSDPSDRWTLEFAAPGEMPLTAGVYLNATRYPFQSLNVPGLDIYGQGRGSNTLTGEFTVHEVVYGPAGEVLVFDASFELHNEGRDPALTGHVRFVAAGTGGVLANDSDADGNPLSAVLLSGPSHGTLTLNANGQLEYTPDADFTGIDTFTYQVSDGTALSNPATVTISVSPANDAPTSNGQTVSTSEDEPFAGSVTGEDIDGDSLEYTVVAGPANGTLAFNLDGTFTFTPNLNFHGSDNFSFLADDGTVLSNVATVSITINSINDAPTGNGQTVSTDEDGSLSCSVTGEDMDGDSLEYTLVNGPVNGSIVFNLDGTFTYTPTANFHGSDSFTFKANDGTADSEPATVSITVNSINDAPTANGQTVSISEDGSLSGSVTGMDSEGDSLEYTLVGGPANGAIVFNLDGTFTYTPTANFHGSDSFTFQTNDGTANSEPATVSITIDPVNDAPTLTGAAFVLAENSGVNTIVGSVAGADGDGDSLTYQIVSGNSSGAFTIDPATGVIRVANSLPLDFETISEFSLTIQVADGGGLVAAASVIVTLTDVSETLILTIDVLPYDPSNTISSSGLGQIEVAIFSTADFDVHSLNFNSLRFGQSGSENSLKLKKGKPQYRYEDVNDDGLLDVIVLFERDLMGFHAGDTEVHLTGQTLDGTAIAGEDDVNLSGNWPN